MRSPFLTIATGVLVAALAACGGGSDEPSSAPESSATESAAAASGELSVKAKAAAANAEAAFDSKYEGASENATDDASAFAAQRQALADYDAALRAADLDPVAEERNALLTAIGAEIAVLDKIAGGDDSDAVIDELVDAHGEVVDAKTALYKVTQ